MNDISGNIDGLSFEEKRTLLGRLLQEEAEAATVFPLSFAQERLWFLDQMQGPNSTYNIKMILRIQGPLKIEVLRRCFDKIVSRHEVLRTTFILKDGKPFQVIGDPFSVPLQLVGLKHLQEKERPAKLNTLAVEEIERPFNLEKGPLIRVNLLELADEVYVLLLTMHHIITDAWSMRIFLREMAGLYEAFSEGKSSPLGELSIQYADFASWQRQWMTGHVLEKHLNYWKKELSGILPKLELPMDRPRPLVQTFNGNTEHFKVGVHITQELKLLCQRTGTTLFMNLFSSFAILLFRYTNQEDIVIGTPIANRSRKEIEPLIGFFVNTLPLLINLSGNPTFLKLLKRVRRTTLKAYNHQDLPFEKLVDEIKLERDLSRNPLVQVMFILQNVEQDKLEQTDIIIEPMEIERLTAKFDITLSMAETGDGLSGSLEYKSDLFDNTTIKRMIGHFCHLLEGIVDNSHCRISELPMLSEAERHLLLREWNDTRADYPEEKTLHELFQEQVELTPHHMAVVFEDQQVTYWELNREANRYARLLRYRGMILGTIAALLVERSIDMIVGILGILKAGGAYLPIDIECPGDRIQYILKDSRTPFLLSSPSMNIENSFLTIIDINSGQTGFEDDSNLTSTAKAFHPAYVIYTSGTTGWPKGVVVEHGAVLNLLFALHSRYPLTKRDTYLLKTSYLFDVSITELFGWFLEGGRLAVLEAGGEKDPEAILAMIVRECVTHINFVPSMFNAFFYMLNAGKIYCLSRLKYIFLAGETLLPDAVNKFRELKSRVVLENLYGPTEAAVYASGYSLADWNGSGMIPIGKPLENVGLYVLDGSGHFQPVGVPGELCISGVGLGRGYLNRPESTAEKFVLVHSSWLTTDRREKKASSSRELPMSYELSAMSCLYKTGDLVRWLPDGNLEFHGRLDRQVKIRGFRIETGEIENLLQKHKKIREAAVITREEGDDKYLCAYVIPYSEETFNVSELREYLSRSLPGYMIPSYFVPLSRLPLTSSGKLDRKKLPAIEKDRPQLSVTFVAPNTELEKLIADTWKKVLKLERVGLHDNFFDLGGNSLKVIELNSKLKEVLNEDIPVVEMFKYMTVNSFIRYLKERKTGGMETYRRSDRNVLINRARKSREMQKTRRKKGNASVRNRRAG